MSEQELPAAITEARKASAQLLRERAKWYREGCPHLEDGDDYASSGDLMRDAADDLDAALDLLLLTGWRDIASAPKDGTKIIAWHEEGLDICWFEEPQPDGPDDMGHDGGWFGILYSAPGRSFGNPKYFHEAQGQPLFWMLPDPPPATPQEEP